MNEKKLKEIIKKTASGELTAADGYCQIMEMILGKNQNQVNEQTIREKYKDAISVRCAYDNNIYNIEGLNDLESWGDGDNYSIVCKSSIGVTVYLYDKLGNSETFAEVID